jgi:hypothetical protein
MFPNAMRARDHNGQNRRPQQTRETKRARLKGRLDPEDGAMREKHDMRARPQGLLCGGDQSPIARCAVFRLNAEVAHAPKCWPDPRPFQDLLTSNHPHRQRELAQGQDIRQPLVQRDYDVRAARQVG